MTVAWEDQHGPAQGSASGRASALAPLVEWLHNSGAAVFTTDAGLLPVTAEDLADQGDILRTIGFTLKGQQ